MSVTLLVVRHAKADRSVPRLDTERPLTGRGRRDAAALGRHLADAGTVPDLVACSPAVRARETWRLAAGAFAAEPPVTVEPTLYAASLDELLAVVAGLPEPAGTAALVGHNPGLSELVDALTDTGTEPVELRTGAVAVLTAAGGWPDLAPGTAALAGLHTARA